MEFLFTLVFELSVIRFLLVEILEGVLGNLVDSNQIGGINLFFVNFSLVSSFNNGLRSILLLFLNRSLLFG